MDVGKLLDGSIDQNWYRMPDTKVEIEIKYIKPKRYTEIIKEATFKKLSNGVMVNETNPEKLGQLLLEEAVVGWKNIERDGKPLPCNPENRKLLNENWTEFKLFWNLIVSSFQDAQALRVEAEEKN